jgi:hypothetical protein
MRKAVLNQIPKGEELTSAIVELAENEHARYVKEQIQRGLTASSNPTELRTAHADFMVELKTEIMTRIDAQ